MNILFVGSFKPPSDGKIGGQYFACTSLLTSSLAKNFRFILVDSTLESIHVTSPLFRLHRIVSRFLSFLYNLCILKVDVVLIFSSSGLSFLEKGVMAIIARTCGKKVVFFPRSGLILNDVTSTVFRFYLKCVFAACNTVICQSNYWKSIFHELAPQVCEKKFVIIENWLPERYFAEFSPLKANVDLERSLKVLFLNRIEKDKGVYDFVDAVKIASSDIKLTADIYGDGREVEALKKYLIQQGVNNTVSFKGWLKDGKEQIVRSYDLYVFASHREGFPNSLLEVMALGVPVISTNVGAVNDLVVSGKNGFLVNIQSPDEIAKCLVELSENRELLGAFSQRALNRVRGNNRLEVAVEHFKKILSVA